MECLCLVDETSTQLRGLNVQKVCIVLYLHVPELVVPEVH